MIGFVKDNFVYIKCPKNGCSTYSALLIRAGWQKINLFENNLNFNDYILWGHLTNPQARHTKGVSQYLKLNPDININDPVVAKMLVSGVFDEHTYSISMMLGPLRFLPIYWIPLDVTIKDYNHPEFAELQASYNGDELTNNFFKENDINLSVSSADRRNVSGESEKNLQDQIDQCKLKYHNNYQQLIKNFLEQDILLYNATVKKFQIKYGSTE